ncbi:methyl-accepting chemotaxis protein [Parazoarcus communis]|uniref:Methyl-accepting chemotaxis protein n=1 Tax=Parazoarcus communis SWub3 = DSM 12120 TaxID=1121029 RepID=A0A323UYC2_9RHOO|nr:methyl-accepting chemotaxis protein [Parazoarcus communis]NMG70361.1 methyl-accepting chemotaxis protein [Parazoarcus communis SWub3 = DSM 12120]PZA17211.1 methyl-accepting chemotaxis protein [Azoarcus communis] [Parazoarcus communis SWub3 = DSM 12120]
MNQLKLRTKIALLVFAAFVGLVATSLIAAFAVKQDLMNGRKLQVESVVQSAYQMVAGLQAAAAKGEISEDEARRTALRALQLMRYGGTDGKAEYLYVWTSAGVSVMHPVRPEWAGRNMTEEIRDGAGRYTIKDIISVARASGSGFVDTSFPRPGQTVAVDKLQYIMTFQPWDWVIGTGVYVDDVANDFTRRLTQDLLIAGAIVLVIIGIGVFIARSVLRQIGGEPAEAMALMERAAAGDLTVDVRSAVSGSMLSGLGRMLAAIRDTIGQISAGSTKLMETAESISHASSEVATAAQRQADSTSAMAAAIEQMTVSINHISDGARETERDSSVAAEMAETGERRVSSASSEMHSIERSVSSAADQLRTLESRTNEISSIANVIKEIAAQTNLLALNAAIEAARAGEQGRGFAVVADEVRKLAERTSTATEEIGAMIGAIQSGTANAVGAMEGVLPQVAHGVELAQQAAQSLRDIKAGAATTLDRIRDVALATQEQSAASNAIAQQVEGIAQMVEETSVSMQNTAGSANTLEQVARDLGTLVARFRC